MQIGTGIAVRGVGSAFGDGILVYGSVGAGSLPRGLVNGLHTFYSLFQMYTRQRYGIRRR